MQDLFTNRGLSLLKVQMHAGSVSFGPHIVVIPFERLKIDKDQGTILLPGVAKSDLQKLAAFP
jgi:hypothetical protein